MPSTKGDCNVNSGCWSWVMITCQYRLIHCNKCPPWWGILIVGKAEHAWGQRVDWNSVFSAQFSEKLKLLLKIILKKKNYTLNLHSKFSFLHDQMVTSDWCKSRPSSCLTCLVPGREQTSKDFSLSVLPSFLISKQQPTYIIEKELHSFSFTSQLTIIP